MKRVKTDSDEGMISQSLSSFSSSFLNLKAPHMTNKEDRKKSDKEKTLSFIMKQRKINNNAWKHWECQEKVHDRKKRASEKVRF